MLPLLIALALIGQPLAVVELMGPAGERVMLPPKTGRPVVIDLFATWCGPCRESMPALERLRARFGDRVDFVSVAQEGDVAKVRAFVAEMKLGSRVLLDGDGRAYKAWGAHRLPTTFIVDGEGVIVKINHGYGTGYEARLTAWLEALLARSGARR